MNLLVDETGNPVQVIRGLVAKSCIDREAALVKMGLKLWSQDLDKTKFSASLRCLESNLSDNFCNNLFQKL